MWNGVRAAIAVAVIGGCGDDARLSAEVERVSGVQSEPEPTTPSVAPIEAGFEHEVVVPPPVTLGALCEGPGSLVAATCRIHVGCRASATTEAIASCEAHLGETCRAEVARLEARVAARRVSFSKEAWERCHAALADVACDEPAVMLGTTRDGPAMMGQRHACDAVFVGRLARGEACEDAGDCAPGLACVTADGSCPGQCLPLAGLDALCHPELEPCGPSLSCEGGRCVAARVLLGAACVADSQCPDGATCLDPDEGGVCAPKRENGARCDDDDRCASGFCKVDPLADELGSDEGRCAVPLGEGDACEPVVGGCGPNLVCEGTTGRCERVASGPGATCGEDETSCGALVCEAARCELEPTLGDVCDPAVPGHCAFGRCAADGALHTCQPFLGLGAACGDDAECGASSCVAGTCAATDRCAATRKDINVGVRFRVR